MFFGCHFFSHVVMDLSSIHQHNNSLSYWQRASKWIVDLPRPRTSWWWGQSPSMAKEGTNNPTWNRKSKRLWDCFMWDHYINVILDQRRCHLTSYECTSHLTQPKERHQWQPWKFLFTVDLGYVFVTYGCKSSQNYYFFLNFCLIFSLL